MMLLPNGPTSEHKSGLSRRELVKYGTVAALATVVQPSITVAQSRTVSGIVYENRSGGNGRAPSDPGIAGVLVSNGHEVVKTDADGRYTLPIDDESIIFIIKPSGYVVPVDQDMLPRFYYIHQPAGSPPNLKLRYAVSIRPVHCRIPSTSRSRRPMNRKSSMSLSLPTRSRKVRSRSISYGTTWSMPWLAPKPHLA
jgi:N terminal of Calcineurin-like phosphoesterase